MPRKWRSFWLAVGTAAASAAVAYALWPMEVSIVALSVIVGHELAHMIMAWLVHGDADWPIFIPLGIAVLAYTKVRGIPEQFKGHVYLAGPVVGALIALVLAVIATLFTLQPLLLAAGVALLCEFYSATFGSDGRKYRAQRKRMRDGNLTGSTRGKRRIDTAFAT